MQPTKAESTIEGDRSARWLILHNFCTFNLKTIWRKDTAGEPITDVIGPDGEVKHNSRLIENTVDAKFQIEYFKVSGGAETRIGEHTVRVSHGLTEEARTYKRYVFAIDTGGGKKRLLIGEQGGNPRSAETIGEFYLDE